MSVVQCAATGSKTAIYNVDKDGDPCEYADDKNACETQYLIKWKNWSHIHNTWESEASLKEQKVNGLKKVENYIKKEDELSKWYVLFLCILFVNSSRLALNQSFISYSTGFVSVG